MADQLIPLEINTHYSELYDESDRLDGGPFGRIELIRTKEIISRYLPPPPAAVIDIGGGPGVYGKWLTDQGYEVTLVDPVETHVEQARAAGIVRSHIGVAGSLLFDDSSFELALLLGPLYHLQESSDRQAALREARRVLRPDGVAVVAAITRFASAIDGLYNGTIDHEPFERIVSEDLRSGRHMNDTGNPEYFTTAYFHRPDELTSELEAAGFEGVEVLAVEGVSWAAPDLDERVGDPARLAAMLDLLRRLEAEPSLMGASPHFLAIGRA